MDSQPFSTIGNEGQIMQREMPFMAQAKQPVLIPVELLAELQALEKVA